MKITCTLILTSNICFNLFAFEILGNRRICLARELTKKFEEIFRGDLQKAIDKFDQTKKPKGEFTLVIEGAIGGAN